MYNNKDTVNTIYNKHKKYRYRIKASFMYNVADAQMMNFSAVTVYVFPLIGSVINNQIAPIVQMKLSAVGLIENLLKIYLYCKMGFTNCRYRASILQ